MSTTEVLIRAEFSGTEMRSIIRALEVAETLAVAAGRGREAFALPMLRARCEAMVRQSMVERRDET